MRILVLENREKTQFWNAVFADQEFESFEIFWIVQNPIFNKNLVGSPIEISFPSAQELKSPSQDENLVTDRGRDFFKSGDKHYSYYFTKINEIIKSVNPNVVIGESTLFHELMAIKICRNLDIPFLHPVSERYPQRRFAVFSGTSQVPAVQSRDIMTYEDAIALSERISENKEVLNYLPSSQWKARAVKKSRWFFSRYRVVLARFLGEVYNTPSLLQKQRLAKKRDGNLKLWDKHAKLPESGERSILYPMQMQPENTIDVWGVGFHDQVKIVQEILDASSPDTTVSVKANPKPYYELGDDLLDFCIGHPRVNLLPRSVSMVDAMQLTIGAITITGTVGFEAACGRGRCISISHPILADEFPSLAATNISEATQKLLHNAEAGKGSVTLGARLMQLLTARSFAGYISDPVSDPSCLEPENVKLVARQLKRAIELLDIRKWGG